MKTRTQIKTTSALAAAAMAVILPVGAELLVYEPFDYPDGPLNGQGGALGTSGSWTTFDTGEAQGWWVHPEGELTGIAVDTAPTLNVFDGTVDNLPTSGGFAGMIGPEDRSAPQPYGFDGGTGNLDASIELDPAVTATFTSGATTWFSFVSVHAWDRNQGAPQFMICTDPTLGGPRGLTMSNAGNGIGAGGGPPRNNLQDLYPQFFDGGVNNHTPGGYEYEGAVVFGTGTFGLHSGVQVAFGSGNDGTAAGQLDENGQARTQTMQWVRDNTDGSFGAVNIVIGKIEWDADTGGEDVISMVRFLEEDTLDEAGFDAVIATLPALSSRNWASNKPDLDQSQFDLINFSSLKFFVDEIRIGTTFQDVVTGGAVAPPTFPVSITPDAPGYLLAWESRPGMLYNVRSNTDLSAALSSWTLVEGNIAADSSGTNSKSVNPSEPVLFYRVEEFPAPPVAIFTENFDGTVAPALPADWTTGQNAPFTASTTMWELGTPSNVGPVPPDIPLPSGGNCVGTGIPADYDDPVTNDGTPYTDIWLRTAPIDLTGHSEGTLGFQYFTEIEDVAGDLDYGSIRILDATGDTELAVLEDRTIDASTGGWKEYSKALPAEAFTATAGTIRIEFRFEADDLDSYSGWYIDDVVVTVPAQ